MRHSTISPIALRWRTINSPQWILRQPADPENGASSCAGRARPDSVPVATQARHSWRRQCRWMVHEALGLRRCRRRDLHPLESGQSRSLRAHLLACSFQAGIHVRVSLAQPIRGSFELTLAVSDLGFDCFLVFQVVRDDAIHLGKPEGGNDCTNLSCDAPCWKRMTTESSDTRVPAT